MNTKPISMLLILTLSAFYLSVLALVLKPDVSEEYRRYYITRESGLSPTQIRRLQNAEPGDRLGFRSDKLGFDSWSNPESEFRWSLGNSPKLHFLLDAEHKTEAIRSMGLRFQPLGQQKVQIQINGHTLFDQQIDSQGPVEVTFSLPPSLLQMGNNVISFQLPNARQPGNGDSRTLGIALSEIVLNRT